MPPASRKSAQHSRNAQPTLSFNSKPTKVTKPAILDASIKKTSKTEPALVEAITNNAPTSEVALKQQIKTESNKPKDEATLKAERITDIQIKKYWKKEEDGRKAPRGMLV
jgi:DNA polymerase delta subunit 4